MILTLLMLALILLAYVNGANDNFKGVASLYGSRTLSYSNALRWATLTTFAGSLTAIMLAPALLTLFSGRGLVPDRIVESTSFLMSVAAGAGGTVLIATLFGFPVSTTHALIGGLTGAGSVAAGAEVDLDVLQRQFLMPLLLGPALSAILAATVLVAARAAGMQADLNRGSCVCLVEAKPMAALTPPAPILVSDMTSTLTIQFDSEANCAGRDGKRLVGVDVGRTADAAHVMSAGLVGFARGLSDTPKVAALLAGLHLFSVEGTMAGVAGLMAIGGILGARRVADTMSHRITRVDHSDGLIANVVTSVLIVTAALSGLPMSTTHVSVGALSGIGLANRQAQFGVISSILCAWALTLPSAALLAATAYWMVS